MKTVKKVFLNKKFSIRLAIIMAIIGIAMQFVASYIVSFVIDNIFHAGDAYMQTVGALLEMTPKMIFYVCIVAPVFEEIIFRGLICGIASKFMPFILANVIQAAVFGIYHGNIFQAVYAFVLGMFIGYLMHLTGGIVYTMIFHSALNFMGLYIDSIIDVNASFFTKTVVALFCLVVVIVLIFKSKLYTL